MPTTVEQLARLVDGEVHGDATLVVSDGRSIERAGATHMTFAGNAENLKKLAGCKAGAVLIGRSLFKPDYLAGEIRSLIVVEDAQRAFITLLQHFRPRRNRLPIGISNAATVSVSAKIGENTNIFPSAWIGDD